MIQPTSLLDIPWDDIIFNNIFPRLTLKDVLNIRQISDEYYKLANSYIINLKCLFLEVDLSSLELMVLAEETRRLEKLKVNGQSSRVTNEFVKSVLRNNKCLTHVNLSYTNLSDCSLHGLIWCKNLRQLLLKNCYWLTNESLEVLIHHLQHLEYLDVRECILLRIQTLVPMLCCMPSIKYFHASTGNWDESTATQEASFDWNGWLIT